MRIPAIMLLLAAAIAPAAQVTLYPEQDAYVCDCVPGETNPNGDELHLYQGQYGACFDRSLIQFDLFYDLPDDVEIQDAELRLKCLGFWGTESGQMKYYRISESWDEDTVTFNTLPDWDDDYQATTGWPEPGSWHAVDVTTFVAAWYAGTIDNFGFYCHSSGTTGQCVAGYHSSDAADPDNRPQLVITYSGSDLNETSWGLIKAD